jgi:hypothetical protein
MERDEKGQFEKGNSGGPGRPKRPTEIAFMRTLVEECDLEKWRSIIASTIKAAEDGDPRARDFLAKYLLGESASKSPTLLGVHLQAMNGVDPVFYAKAHAKIAKQPEWLPEIDEKEKALIIEMAMREQELDV